jgi:hypothetical protein
MSISSPKAAADYMSEFNQLALLPNLIQSDINRLKMEVSRTVRLLANVSAEIWGVNQGPNVPFTPFAQNIADQTIANARKTIVEAYVAKGRFN